LFGAAVVITLIIFYSEYVLLLTATLFVASGLVLKLLQMVRRFLSTTVAAPSVPAHGNIET
jgi:hypothetical protein